MNRIRATLAVLLGLVVREVIGLALYPYKALALAAAYGAGTLLWGDPDAGIRQGAVIVLSLLLASDVLAWGLNWASRSAAKTDRT